MLFFTRARRVSASSSGLSSTSRMTRCRMAAPRSLKGEIEGGAAIDRPLGPHAAAVPVDDPLHRSEADAGPGKLLRRVEPLERAEQLVGVRHVEPHPIVPHEVHRMAVLRRDPELDPRLLALRGELPRIPQQVLEDDLEEAGVALCRGMVGADELDAAREVAL